MGYILFSSPHTLSVKAVHVWNGIIEYSFDNVVWKKWNGKTISNDTIYMRGINNTVISNLYWWYINGKNVRCQGNIENLLDYQSVINNIHPKMDSHCFSHMFYGCNSLTEAPQLSSLELANFCYCHMFEGCFNLKTAPMLPSKYLSEGCYLYMFAYCDSLIEIPLLMAEKINSQCYQEMFRDCHSLSNISNLRINQIGNNVYWKMFEGCTSIVNYPTFANLQTAKEAIINQKMFTDCSITKININNKLYDINVLKLL